MINKNKTAIKDLQYHRKELEQIDEEIITRIFTRNKIVEEIAKLKYVKKLKIKQPEVKNSFEERRVKKIKKLHLNKKVLKEIFDLIHDESVKIQKKVVKELKNDQK